MHVHIFSLHQVCLYYFYPFSVCIHQVREVVYIDLSCPHSLRCVVLRCVGLVALRYGVSYCVMYRAHVYL
jgi:hypothetical protein